MSSARRSGEHQPHYAEALLGRTRSWGTPDRTRLATSCASLYTPSEVLSEAPSEAPSEVPSEAPSKAKGEAVGEGLVKGDTRVTLDRGSTRSRPRSSAAHA